MRCALLAVLLCGCHGEPSPAPPQPTGSAVPAVVPSKPDPWAVGPASSPDDPPSLTERHARADKVCPRVVHPFFFAIEKDHHTSYLLGSRHVGVSLAKMPDAVREHVRSAKLAVFEVAPDDSEHPKPHKADLHAALGDALWQRYSKLVGKTIADETEVGPPSAALLNMMIMYEDITTMLDMEIEKAVLEAHIPTRGLESSRFQDDLIEKLLDVRALRATVAETKDRAELEDSSRTDLQKYCTGTQDKPGTSDKDRVKMRAAGYTDAEIDEMDEELVFARNAKWIPELEPLLAQDDVLIVVGADHLIGPRGVPALLAARGYHVTRVEH